MRKLRIPKKELVKITEEQKKVACHFAMPSGWNPMGNPELFRDIQESIFNYFLGRKHKLSSLEVESILKVEKEEKTLHLEETQGVGKNA